MEQRNIIEWSEHSEYRELTIPSGEIWMSESELVDLFGVFITIKAQHNVYLTVYNMEVVLLLAFRLNSYQARAIRKELMERIERDHKPFEVILTASRGTGGLM